MKYHELERKLKDAGCYPVDDTINGHPAWYSPITDEYFMMSHHGTNEVKTGTLKSILKASGVTLSGNKKKNKDNSKND